MEKKNFSHLGSVVMASGLSSRFGSNKLLAELEGQTLIEKTLCTLAQAGLEQLLVVTRSHEVQKLAQGLGAHTLLHKLPYQSDTVALGVQYWQKSGQALQGLIFSTSDQPLLQPQTLQLLCHEFLQVYAQNPGPLIFRLGARQGNKLVPGNPVIFSSELFPELLQIPQDKGGAILCQKYPQLVHILEVSPQELLDIDTPEDLQQLKSILQK